MSDRRDLLYLSRDEVETLLPDVDEQVDLVERTYRALARGRVELPPKPGVHPRPDAFLHAMPAYLRDDDVVAMKWVAGYPENPAKGLPYISGLVVLNDAATGLPTAVMDAAAITAARTAAASGVCIRAWAPEGWRRAAILGCGEQGRFHAAVLEALCPGYKLRAFDVVSERARAIAGDGAAETPAEAVAGAEVVVTSGPIREKPEPVVGEAWLGEAFLVLPLDFDALVARDVVEAADLFLVDDLGQFEYYRAQGHFVGWPPPAASVGEALERGLAGARVVCVNLGIGALDAAFASEVLRRARAAGVGTRLPL
jgi:ornithine cyclodeaminase/alanine dehydrogenase